MITKRAGLVVLLGVALSACSGGGGSGDGSDPGRTDFKDPDSVDFGYGAEHPGVEDTANLVALNAEQVLAFAEADAGTAPALADAMSDNPQWTDRNLLPGLGNDFPRTPSLRAALAAAEEIWDDPGCQTLTATALTFDHCSAHTDNERLTVDGAYQRAPGHASWDVTRRRYHPATTEEPYSASDYEHAYGEIDASSADSTLTGGSRVDYAVSITYAGVEEGRAVALQADYDLGYATDPDLCIDGGTLTVKRVWTRLPANQDGDTEYFTDAALRFTWTGCDQVSAAITW